MVHCFTDVGGIEYELPIYGGKKSEVRRCKYNGRDFEKGKKREDEPQGGISWPDTIQDTEDEVDMNRYTLENQKTRKKL